MVAHKMSPWNRSSTGFSSQPPRLLHHYERKNPVYPVMAIQKKFLTKNGIGINGILYFGWNGTKFGKGFGTCVISTSNLDVWLWFGLRVKHVLTDLSPGIWKLLAHK